MTGWRLGESLLPSYKSMMRCSSIMEIVSYNSEISINLHFWKSEFSASKPFESIMYVYWLVWLPNEDTDFNYMQGSWKTFSSDEILGKIYIDAKSKMEQYEEVRWKHDVSSFALTFEGSFCPSTSSHLTQKIYDSIPYRHVGSLAKRIDFIISN